MSHPCCGIGRTGIYRLTDRIGSAPGRAGSHRVATAGVLLHIFTEPQTG